MFLFVKTLLFTALIPGMVTVYLPYLLISRSWDKIQTPHPLLAASVALIILAGVAGYCRCAWEFAVRGLGTPAPIDAPKKLVVTGLYQWTRNPMFLSMQLILLAEALFFQRVELFIYAGCVVLALHLLVLLHEEPNLHARFGPSPAPIQLLPSYRPYPIFEDENRHVGAVYCAIDQTLPTCLSWRMRPP